MKLFVKIFSILLVITLTACGGSGGESILPTAAALGVAQNVLQAATTDCTVQTGSFTLTAIGFSGTAPSGTATYKLFPCSNLAFIFLPGLAGTSNETSFTAGPLPAALIPATIATQEHAVNGFDNDIETSPMSIIISSGSSTIQYLKNGSTDGWTASGSKGVGLQIVTVFLD